MGETNDKPTDAKPEEQQSNNQSDGDKKETTPNQETIETNPKEMRAIVLTGFGGLKTVKVQKKSEPTVGEGEVLIRVKACGLNFPDLMLRQGVIDNPPKAPFIMGFECSGDIEALGDGVQGLKVGDRVAALTESRAWAELTSVPAKHVYKIPDSMSYNEAAAITMNYVVAYALINDIGNVKSGQTLLVHSIGGGVGQAITQMVKGIPDVTLIGTASKHKHDALKDNVDHVLDHSTDYVQEIKKISPDGVDLVLDCLCGDDANKGYGLLKPMGRYVLYGTAFIVAGETKSFFSFAKSWWQVDKINPMKLYDENKTLSGFNLRHLLYQQGRDEYVRGVVEKVYKLFTESKIKPVIDSSWAFEDIPEAMQKLHDRKNVGKITLDPAQEPKPKPVEEEPAPKGKRKSSSKDKNADKEKSSDKDDKKTDESKKGDDKKEGDGKDAAAAEAGKGDEAK